MLSFVADPLQLVALNPPTLMCSEVTLLCLSVLAFKCWDGKMHVIKTGCRMLQDGQGNKALFIDGGVYTRNRAFRLFLSSKAGKDWVLHPTGACQVPTNLRMQHALTACGDGS